MSSSDDDKQQVLSEFRRTVEAEGIIQPGDTIGTDDNTLLRFLRARKFDQKNAKTMLEECQRWRKSVEGVGLDALYDEIDPFDYPERDAVFKYWPMWFHKTDKQGRPLNIQTFGAMDVAALYKHVSPARHWRIFLTNAEALTREVLPACSRAKGEQVKAAFCIVDLKGFGLGQFWRMKSLVRDSFQVSQDYYPETMGRLIVVNAPASFTIIWSAIKPWLAPETVAKVDILGSDYTEALRSHVDAENLPASLGGVCMCNGLGGCSLSSAGPWLDGRVYKGHGPSRFRARLGKEEEGVHPKQDAGQEHEANGEGDQKPPPFGASGEKVGEGVTIEPRAIKDEDAKWASEEFLRETEVQPNGYI